MVIPPRPYDPPPVCWAVATACGLADCYRPPPGTPGNPQALQDALEILKFTATTGPGTIYADPELPLEPAPAGKPWPTRRRRRRG